MGKGKKRGKFSSAERNFITRNAHEMTVEEIAKDINRTVPTVQKFITENNLGGSVNEEDEQQNTALRRQLEKRSYWPSVKNQLNEDELQVFIDSWVRSMRQFEEDIKWTEETQMRQWIVSDILLCRCGVKQKTHEEMVDRLQEVLDVEFSKDVDDRDIDKIANMQQQLEFSKGASSIYNKDYIALTTSIEKLQKSLKATREGRIQRIDDSKTSWIGYLRLLEDEGQRKQIGEEMELMRLAKNKARERLSEYHEYEDGMIDQPFLTPETLIVEE